MTQAAREVASVLARDALEAVAGQFRAWLSGPAAPDGPRIERSYWAQTRCYNTVVVWDDGPDLWAFAAGPDGGQVDGVTVPPARGWPNAVRALRLNHNAVALLPAN